MIKIHEYQAKDLLTKYGLPFQRRVLVSELSELKNIPATLGQAPWVVKAQVLAGGRGKAGGVKLVNTPEELLKVSKGLLGQSLVTVQTGPQGEPIESLLIEKASTFHHEYYVAVTVDRQLGVPVMLASSEGGMDIEQLAKERPEAILRVPIHPLAGLQPFQSRGLAISMGFTGKEIGEASKVFQGLVKGFLELDATLVEINPLVVTDEHVVVCIDAKLNFDENAVFRHKEYAELVGKTGDPREARAKAAGLSYVGLEGSIGCLVNGAGLAMATMDIIKLHGGEPANFLDVGGGATADTVAEAFSIIMADAQVRAILVNIFGGIMKCDVIATGIVEAMKKTSLHIPLVVRLEGTNVEEGRDILKKSRLQINSAMDLDDAARQVVNASRREQ